MAKRKKHNIGSALLAAGCLLVLFEAESALAQFTEAEEAAIREVAQLYVDGVKYADSEKINLAFHDEWRMTGFFADGDYRRIDREEFIDITDQGAAAATSLPRFEGGIVDIFISGRVAVVQVHLENDEVIFSDYLSLVNIDGDWSVIHKVWDTESKTGS